jgi:sigma-B regulation protein RsbU (phosphoserine phosphatase)
VATTEDNLPLPRMLEQINTHLYHVGRRKTFVTMAMGVLDTKSRTLDYVRAGHNPVVWRSPSTGFTRLLETSGLGLGITGGPVFARKLAVERLELSSGDTLVFYSDGLTEAMNPQLEEFGEERLMQAVERLDALPAEEARDSILAAVKLFLDGNHPQDDLTLVVLRVE